MLGDHDNRLKYNTKLEQALQDEDEDFSGVLCVSCTRS